MIYEEKEPLGFGPRKNVLCVRVYDVSWFFLNQDSAVYMIILTIFKTEISVDSIVYSIVARRVVMVRGNGTDGVEENFWLFAWLLSLL